MDVNRQFNIKELRMVEEAADASEEMVNNHFKMSSSQWLKNRYDIKTAKDLAPHEQVNGPFAQVIKYEARPTDRWLGSSSYSLYKVCIQDAAILSALDKVIGLKMAPFLLYILTHELIHVVRFSNWEQRYENKDEADVTLEEEQKVHELTYRILAPMPIEGLMKVFEFYRDWRFPKGLV